MKRTFISAQLRTSAAGTAATRPTAWCITITRVTATAIATVTATVMATDTDTATGITTVVRQSGGRFHALAQPTMANSNKDSATSWGNSDGSNELIAWPPAIRLTASVST